MQNAKIGKLGLISLLVTITVIFIFLFTFPREVHKKTAYIGYEGNDISVLVADSIKKRAQGLSGTFKETLGADGMLFVFNERIERRFWMNKMNYDLDILWIEDGLIRKIEKGIPAPEAGEQPVFMNSEPYSVNIVLELPAGGVDEFGLKVGEVIDMSGIF